MAGNLNQFEWAEKFITDFKDRLDPEQQEQYFSLANVTLNIKKKNFDEALRYLSRFKSRNEVEKITIKRFQLMIYYESDFLDELYSLIDTSKHFICNDRKVAASAKTIFNNFLYFVGKLAESKSKTHFDKHNGSYLDTLKNEIQEKEVTNKIWLLEKVIELEAKNKISK